MGDQPEAKIVTSYVGQGAPRFFFAMAPELPDPSFAKIVVLTPDAEAREALKLRLREAVSQGLAPEANLRVTQLVFGPYTPFPVEFRVMGPDPAQLYSISEKALDIMRGVPDVRQANRDWGNRTPVPRFIPDRSSGSARTDRSFGNPSGRADPEAPRSHARHHDPLGHQ
jgi:multidrug efflux pump subunit AcrB